MVKEIQSARKFSPQVFNSSVKITSYFHTKSEKILFNLLDWNLKIQNEFDLLDFSLYKSTWNMKTDLILAKEQR
mgnify:CR=1 FL=1